MKATAAGNAAKLLKFYCGGVTDAAAGRVPLQGSAVPTTIWAGTEAVILEDPSLAARVADVIYEAMEDSGGDASERNRENNEFTERMFWSSRR